MDNKVKIKDEVFSLDDFAKVTGMTRLKKFGIPQILMRFLGLARINQIVGELSGENDIEFISSFFNLQRIRLDFEQRELKNIPQSGAFISVSNHPFGGLEGMILIYLLRLRRPDCKILANYLLLNLKQLKDNFIPVNPLENRKPFSNVKGFKLCLSALDNGTPVSTFPAGTVSFFDWKQRKVTDPEWSEHIGRILKKKPVPVVPIYFEGKNSLFFNIIGTIHPTLRTLLLVRELLNKKKRIIRIRIGKPIKYEVLESFSTPAQMMNFLKAKTYSLREILLPKNQKKIKEANTQPEAFSEKGYQQIIAPIPPETLIKDFQSVEDSILFTERNFVCYCLAPTIIPKNIKTEIARLREKNFRLVGEGTGNSLDIDPFDEYYHQLVIWDKDENKIVGGYRLGDGEEIFKEKGLSGFYISSFFKFKEQFVEVMKHSVEVGRSWIDIDYQKKYQPLLLLWRGILFFLLKHKKFKYLIGGVSISNEYTKLSKSLIVSFIRKHYFDYHLASQVTPRKKYLSRYSHFERSLLSHEEKSFNNLNNIISDIEKNRLAVPILLRKYIELNAKIVAFNIDPNFSNCLDGLVVLKLDNVNQKLLEKLEKTTS